MKRILLVLFVACLITSCKDDQKETLTAPVVIRFDHMVDSAAMIRDSMCYTNAAGNPYEITEIMYFISRVKLYHSNGQVIEMNHLSPFHYVNPDIPASLNWISDQNLPEGLYDSLTFTFGLTEADNISNRFVNPPESNMAWPEVLGGGYHYMMLNGWYENQNGERSNCNFHLGTGQLYDDDHNITGFVNNSFTVNPEGKPFTIVPGDTNVIQCTMNIESWFDTPVVYDFNYWGGAIMQKQNAMHTACLNGKDAFSIKIIH